MLALIIRGKSRRQLWKNNVLLRISFLYKGYMGPATQSVISKHEPELTISQNASVSLGSLKEKSHEFTYIILADFLLFTFHITVIP